MESPTSNPTSSLAGKVALITGGSKGIGKAAAVALARAGAQIVITYMTDAKAADAVVDEIGVHKALALRSDAGDMGDVGRLVDKIVETFGRIDLLIANAGVSPSMEFQSTTEADFDKAFAMNVKGPFFLVQKAAPFMPPKSRVILVSSSMCATSQVGLDKTLYCSTKGAIEQMARLMAKDLGRRDIAVNALAPGATATEQFYKGKPEPVVKAIAGFSPYNRIGTADEVAAVFLFLCGENSQWMTGQTVRVNGGSA